MGFKIGHRHGLEAETEIIHGLNFYEQLFLTSTKLPWFDVCKVAERFLPALEKEWPRYVTEMRGMFNNFAIRVRVEALQFILTGTVISPN